ncbi:hypothetical protein [Streptomyces sp. NPDC002825]|uniref:hypothetical protein n=1 Tax=Streptomyces sp. NPDC002825 TaxID=3154666 RepID=UPI003331D3AD
MRFEYSDGLLDPTGLGQKAGDGPGRVRGVALGMRPRLLDRFVEQAAVGHEPKPQPEEVPLLLASAARLKCVEVGQAVLSPAVVGVQAAQRVDDPVLCADLVGERVHHLDRLVAAAVPDQKSGQRDGHVPQAFP